MNSVKMHSQHEQESLHKHTIASLRPAVLRYTDAVRSRLQHGTEFSSIIMDGQ